MISITLAALSITSFVALFSENISPSKSKLWFLLLAACLILVAGLRNGESMPDYASYSGYYSYLIEGQFTYFIEISFILIAKTSNFIIANNPILMFCIYAILGVSIKFYAIQKLTPLFFYSLVIYVSNYFIIHEMIQIRTGVASAFILLSIVPLQKRKLKNFLFLIGFATFFHYSSFIFVTLWLLRTGKFNVPIYFCLIPIAYLTHIFIDLGVVLNFIASLLPFDGLAEKLIGYSFAREDLTINVFGIYPLSRVIIFIFFLYFIKDIQRYNKYLCILLKMYAFGIFSYIALAIFPIIAVRIGYTLMMTEIILIPYLIYIIKGFYIPRLIIIFYAFMVFIFNVFFTTYFVWSN